MKIYLGIILTLCFACSNNNNEAGGINFAIMDREDTLSHFFYPVYKDYNFQNKGSLDSVIFNKDAQSRLAGTFILGIIDNQKFLHRLLTFRIDSTTSFSDFQNPESLFLHEEYNLSQYEISVLENNIDSSSLPLTMHQTMAAIDLKSKDTVLFQEHVFVQRENDLVYNLVTYDTWKTRKVMKELYEDALVKMNKSTKPNPKN